MSQTKPFLISHRGNLFGPTSDENKPNKIDSVIADGYQVEIDLWLKNDQFFLGHDSPTYEISLDWLVERNKYLWIHCKNIEGFSSLISSELNYFWHEFDKYALTSKNYIWSLPGNEFKSKNCINVLPERKLKNFDLNFCDFDLYGGLCSDFIGNLN